MQPRAPVVALDVLQEALAAAEDLHQAAGGGVVLGVRLAAPHTPRGIKRSAWELTAPPVAAGTVTAQRPPQRAAGPQKFAAAMSAA